MVLSRSSRNLKFPKILHSACRKKHTSGQGSRYRTGSYLEVPWVGIVAPWYLARIFDP